jgi:hypothetical protein
MSYFSEHWELNFCSIVDKLCFYNCSIKNDLDKKTEINEFNNLVSGFNPENLVSEQFNNDDHEID